MSDRVRTEALALGDLKTELSNAFSNNKNTDGSFDFHRNKGVFMKLKCVLQNHNRIHVIYGAWHQPHIAAFLREKLGFKLVRTEWVSVIRFEPMEPASK